MANKSRFDPRNLKSGWPVWVAAAAALVFGLVLLIWPGIATDVILNLCGAALLIARLQLGSERGPRAGAVRSGADRL